MFFWLLLASALASVDVEDLIQNLRRVRRGGSVRKERGFFKDVGKAISHAGNTVVNTAKELGDNTGRFFRGEEICEDKDYFFDCKTRSFTTNKDWMRLIPDHAKITELSIPGTHDTASLHGGGAPWHVIAQSLTVSKQLDAGIRYLDVRPRHFNNQLPIHHGEVYQHESFTGVCRYVNNFLAHHPTETIFMRIKPEHTASGNSRSFNDLIKDTMWNELGRFGRVVGGTNHKANNLNMGQVRGKVVVLQNFGGTAVPGAIGWLDSSVARQDNYEITWLHQVNEKKGQFTNLLNQAQNDPNKLYINHLSGTGAGFGGIKQVAKPMNEHGRHQIRSRARSHGLGIFPMDFPGKSLISDIIKKNPFMLSSGRCGAILSDQQCRQWAADHGFGFSSYKSSRAPRGCYQWHYNNGNNLKFYYNPNTNNACTTYRRCLCN